MIIWGLFDSGNGSYYKVAKDIPNVEYYAIGVVDIVKFKQDKGYMVYEELGQMNLFDT